MFGIRTSRTFPISCLALLILAAAAPVRSARAWPTGIDAAAVWSTYLGGSGDDDLWAVATDAEGNTYVTGMTGSVDFPGAGGAAVDSSGR